MTKIHILCVLLATGLTVPSFAGVIYDESVNGSFSSSGLSPTMVSLALGSNQILGTNGSAATAVRDYLTFEVPAFTKLSSITMLNTAVGNIGFIGLQAGSKITLPTNTATAAGLLGWLHYTAANKNTDILPAMGVPANGSSGFSPPLGPGAYSLWIQDSSPGTFNYGFDLQLAPVPEPATWESSLVAMAGVALLLSLRRRYATSR
jgi:hypothetical protein